MVHRENYAPHVQRFTGPFKGLKRAIAMEERPTGVIGETGEFRPRTPFNARALKRRSADFKYAHDAMYSLQHYLNDVLPRIYQTDNIGRIRQLADAMGLMDYNAKGGDSSAQKGMFGSFKLFLEAYANQLDGKKAKIDYAVEGFTGRKGLAIAQYARQLRSQALLCGNLRTAVTNFLPLIQSAAVSPLYTAVGMGQTLASLRDHAAKFRDFERRSEFLSTTFGGSQIDFDALDKVISLGFVPFNAVDRFVKHSVVHMLYDQGLKKGYTDEVAMRRADRLAHSMLVTRSRSGSGNAYRSPVGGFVLQFTQEATNYLNWAANTLREMNSGAPERNLFGVVILLLGNWLFNWAMNSQTAPDPIGAGQDAAREIEGGGNPIEAIGSAALEVVNPFNRLMSEGAEGIPLVSGATDLVNALTALGDQEPATWEDAYDIMAAVAGFVPYGNSLLRGAEGISEVAQGYSQTDGGLVRYAYDQSGWDYVGAGLLGSSITDESRAYYAGEAKPLSASDSDELKRQIAAGISPLEAWRNVTSATAAQTAQERADDLAALGEDASAAEQEAASLRSVVGVPSDVPDWALEEYDAGYMQNAMDIWRETGDAGVLPKAFSTSTATNAEGEEVRYLQRDGYAYPITEEEYAALEAEYARMYRAVMSVAYSRYNGDANAISRQLSQNRANIIYDFVLERRMELREVE